MESKLTDDKPWLRNEAWRARVLTFDDNPGWSLLILVYLIFGALPLLWVAAALGLTDGSAIDWEMAKVSLFLASLFLLVPAGLTYWMIRHLRFGQTTCRLITLPGVIGGWFKADIECSLPPGTTPLVVRLKNMKKVYKGSIVLWDLKRQVDAHPVSLDGSGRMLVPVRFRLPRHPWQVPDPLEPPAFWESSTCWNLEIEKKCPGVSFFAAFRVPIFDTPDAPESEQLPD